MRAWILAVIVAYGAAGLSPGQDPSSSPSDDGEQRRLEDLSALLTGPNTPEVRRTGARELLRIDSESARTLLLGALNGTDLAARIAVAGAVADVPSAPADSLVGPLTDALCAPEGELRAAAAEALATRGSDALVATLRARLSSDETPAACRVEIASALGRIPLRSAAEALVAFLDASDAALRQTALTALERATGSDFLGDPERARAWWKANESASPEEWRQAQIVRLVAQNRSAVRRIGELETRLAAALRDLFYRLADADRPAALQAYLKDANAIVRRLGLDLVVAMLSEGKTPTSETVAAVRVQLSAAEPPCRAAAARVLASLRSAADAAVILERLSSETTPEARAAMVGALGYLGGGEVAAAVLRPLQDAGTDAATADAAVAALGRLAERRVLDADVTREAVALLTQRLDQSPTGGVEGVIASLARFADPRVADVLAARLDSEESTITRVAAARGASTFIALFDYAAPGEVASQPTEAMQRFAGTAEWARLKTALIAASSDQDVNLRRAAIAALQAAPASDDVFAALWSRALPGEGDEQSRTAAWDAVVRRTERMGVARIVELADSLPATADRAARQSALLTVAERALGEPPRDPAARGALRGRIAALRAETGQPDAAAQTYLAALSDLHTAQSPSIHAISIDALRFALTEDRYYDRIATALAKGNPALDGAALWGELSPALESAAAGQNARTALTQLMLLRRLPPAAFDDAILGQIDALILKANASLDATVAAQIDRCLEAAAAPEQRQELVAGLRESRGRAVRLIASRMETLVSADTPDGAAERLLVEIAMELADGWPGFAADAPHEVKLASIATLAASDSTTE